MNMASKLKHTVDLYAKTGQNSSGEIIYGSAKTINCLIWGSKSRSVQSSQPQSSTTPIDFTVVVLGDTVINVGDQLRNAKDINSVVIFDKVEVMRITPIIRRDTGIISKELSVTNVRG